MERNPYQRIIRDGVVIQPGHINTQEKFKQLTKGIDFTDKSVLDVGCNLGEMCRLAKDAGASYVVGIDERIDYIESAKELNPDLNFIVMSAERLRGKFDIIIASGMFHYINDRDRFFGQMARSGKMVLMDVWLHQEYITKKAKLFLTDRGLFIPNKPAFLFKAGKYFNKITELGESLSPDKSYRVMFKLEDPNPKPPQAILIYGQPGVGKTTLGWNLIYHESLQLDWIFVEYMIQFYRNKFSVKDFVDFVNEVPNQKEHYLNYHRGYIERWLSGKVNTDVTIEGYDLIHEEYRQMVTEVLQGLGWSNIQEIQLTPESRKELKLDTIAPYMQR